MKKEKNGAEIIQGAKFSSAHKKKLSKEDGKERKAKRSEILDYSSCALKKPLFSKNKYLKIFWLRINSTKKMCYEPIQQIFITEKLCWMSA